MRKEKGQDISGACGQLVVEGQKEKARALKAGGARGACRSTGESGSSNSIAGGGGGSGSGGGGGGECDSSYSRSKLSGGTMWDEDAAVEVAAAAADDIEDLISETAKVASAAASGARPAALRRKGKGGNTKKAAAAAAWQQGGKARQQVAVACSGGVAQVQLLQLREWCGVGAALQCATARQVLGALSILAAMVLAFLGLHAD